MRAKNAKSADGVLSTRNPRKPTTPRTRGGAATVLVLALALLLGLGLGAWLLLGPSASGSGAGGDSAASPGPVDEEPARDTPAGLVGARSSVDADPALRQAEPGPAGHAGARLSAGAGSAAEDPDRFEGRGVLRGQLLPGDASSFDTPWTLVLSPSRWLVGSEGATTRRVEHAAGTLEFELENLPLAGYMLTVEAPGWSARPADVLLQRGSETAYVNLSLEPNGIVEGSLFRATNLPATGVALRLERLGEGEDLEADVDATGAFRFDAVPNGNWRLVIGPATSPLMPARLLAVEPSGVVLPPITLPPLSSFRIVVFNAEGDRVVGAAVRGSGSKGGVVEGETDEHGVFQTQDTPPGRWRIRIEHPEEGSLRHVFVVTLETPYEDSLTLER